MFELDEIIDREILSVVWVEWHHIKYGTMTDLGIRCTPELKNMIESFDLKSDSHHILTTDLTDNAVILFTIQEMQTRQWRENQRVTWTYSLFECEFQFTRI
jgi:hypothetical protein